MNVTYVTHMGNDLMVANAARVSFDKHKDEIGEGDERLINYLATHNHWTPFAHPQVCLRVKAPIFVARQLFKHKVGFTENEISRRYVDDEVEFYTPTVWRGRPTDGAKQGSANTEVLQMSHEEGAEDLWGDVDNDWKIPLFIEHFYYEAKYMYEWLLKSGVAPEQARMVLPQAMFTEWYWTGSLAAYARMAKLRLDPHAQAETREIAQMISDIIQPLFPISWEAFTVA